MASSRDKAVVVLAGLAPDVDGLGIVVDFVTRATGLPETDLYQAWHRVYGHGLPAVVVFCALAAWLCDDRVRGAIGSLIAVHLHFLGDVLGSRGTTAEDLWGIHYLAPFSMEPSITWTGQWPLVSWQNFGITAVLLGLTLRRAIRTGYSPVALVSRTADQAVVETLRRRFGRLP